MVSGSCVSTCLFSSFLETSRLQIVASVTVRFWGGSSEALKRRGSLTIWFDPAMIWEAAPTGKRGRQPEDSREEDQETARV